MMTMMRAKRVPACAGCGDRINPDVNDTLCEWCHEANWYAARRTRANDHCTVTISRFSGTIVCVECGTYCDCLICEER